MTSPPAPQDESHQNNQHYKHGCYCQGSAALFGRRNGSAIRQFKTVLRKDGFQFNRNLSRGLVPRIGILVEALQDDAFQLRGENGILGSRRRGLLMQDRFYKGDCCGVFEGTLPGGHHVEHRTQTVDVGAFVVHTRVDLLWRHVRERAHQGTLLLNGFGGFFVGNYGHSGQPKIEHLDAAFLGEKDVLRFEVPMYDAVLVSGGNSPSDLDSEGNDTGFVERALDAIGKGTARQQLEYQEIDVAFRFDGIDAFDVGMIEPGECEGFLAKPSALTGSVTPAFEHLDRNIAFQLHVPGAVHGPHSARTNLLGQSEMTEYLPRDEAMSRHMSNSYKRIV